MKTRQLIALYVGIALVIFGAGMVNQGFKHGCRTDGGTVQNIDWTGGWFWNCQPFCDTLDLSAVDDDPEFREYILFQCRQQYS